VAEQAAARAELDAKNALLEQITGVLPGFVPPRMRAGEARPLVAGLEPLAAWLARVEADNPAVLAAQRGVDAAREDVRRQQALHQPTFDLVAKRARVLQGSGNSPGQSGYRSSEHSYGVQVNVPLFSGGTASAKIREAEALVLKAEAEVEAARRNAVAQARQGWSAAQAARARSEAGEHAQRAAQVALRAATTGQAQGMKDLAGRIAGAPATGAGPQGPATRGIRRRGGAGQAAGGGGTAGGRLPAARPVAAGAGRGGGSPGAGR
jgi:outer membrane protein